MTRCLPLLALALALAVAAGCKPSRVYLRVDVGGPATIDAAAFDVTVTLPSGGGSAQFTVALPSRPLPLPTSFVVDLPPHTRGSVAVAIVANDGAGGTVARGANRVDVAQDGTTDVDVALSTVLVTPDSATLLAGDTVRFTANVPVTWQVTEGSAGGAIDDGGLYVAPDAAGEFHVVATSVADPTQTASVAVTVRQEQLTVLVGQLGGAGSVDGSGASARFNRPAGLALAPDGHLFVADQGNHLIRKVAIATGDVTTVAGTYSPEGVVADGAGNVYFAGQNYIKMLPAAGGPFVNLYDNTSALNFPSGLALDANAAHLYVGAWGDNKLWDVALSGPGQATALKQIMPSAAVAGMRGVAVDPRGFLYVSDDLGCSIRAVALATGAVTFLVGNGSCTGTPSLHAPLGLALSGSTLYVADGNGNVIRQIDVSQPLPPATPLAVAPFAGMTGPSAAGADDGPASTARFHTPYGLAVDASGNAVYVAEQNNHIVRAITRPAAGAPWTVSTVAGLAVHTTGGTADALNGAAALATDGQDTVFFANSDIFAVSLAQKTVTRLAGNGNWGFADGTPGAFKQATGVAYANGHLYVADGGNCAVRDIDLTSASRPVKTLSQGKACGGSSLLGTVQRLCSDGTTVYVSDAGQNAIFAVDAQTGTTSVLAGRPGVAGDSDGPGASAQFRAPMGLACDTGDQRLFIADRDAHTIRVVDLASATHTVSTLAGASGAAGAVDVRSPSDGPLTAARFTAPADVAWDGGTLLYIADQGSSTLRKLDLAAQTLITVAGVAYRGGVRPGTLPAELNGPASVLPLPGSPRRLVVTGEAALLLIAP